MQIPNYWDFKITNPTTTTIGAMRYLLRDKSRRLSGDSQLCLVNAQKKDKAFAFPRPQPLSLGTRETRSSQRYCRRLDSTAIAEPLKRQ